VAHTYGSARYLDAPPTTKRKKRGKAAKPTITKAYTAGVDVAPASGLVAAYRAALDDNIAYAQHRARTAGSMADRETASRWLAENDPQARRRVQKSASGEAREFDEFVRRAADSGNPEARAYLVRNLLVAW
jgi:hypothetical protein